MPNRPRRPNLDERFSLVMHSDEALERILSGEGSNDPELLDEVVVESGSDVRHGTDRMVESVTAFTTGWTPPTD